MAFAAEDWLGTWDSIWDSPTGNYKSDFVINKLVPYYGAIYDAGGYYKGGDGGQGTVAGKVSFELGGTWSIHGQWQRVPGPSGGSSGGPCSYGFINLKLSNSREFVGVWSYCNDDPNTKGYSWTGTKQ
jgi:hypothetical protein